MWDVITNPCPNFKGILVKTPSKLDVVMQMKYMNDKSTKIKWIHIKNKTNYVGLPKKIENAFWLPVIRQLGNVMYE